MKSSPNSPFLELLPHPDSGTTLANHYQTGETIEVTWSNDTLTKINPARGKRAGVWIAPGLFDVQVNGYAGVDFQLPSSAKEDKLLRSVHAMKRDGCNRFLLTLITAKWNDLLDLVASYKKVISSNEELSRSIPGFHIEGPFISSEPGYVGAHDKSCVCDPMPQNIQDLKKVVGDMPVLLTLAPERAGSIDTIKAAVESKFVVSLGHTNASAQQIEAAEGAGSTAFTHLGNGCPQQLDRHDNIIWRILNSKKLTVGIIPDSIHVSPQAFQIMHRSLPHSRIYWTTDAMSAAGAGPGKYTLGKIELAVAEDGVVRNPATGGFAGSSLNPIEGIRRGSKMLNQPWQKSWEHFSTIPARLMKVSSGLHLKSEGGFCLLKETA